MVLGSAAALTQCEISTTVIVVGIVQITVTPSSASLPALTSVQLEAHLTDAFGNALSNRAITWESNNTALATVASTGFVTTLEPGPVTITASAEGVSGQASLTITPRNVIAVEVSPSSATISVSGTQQFTATVKSLDDEVLSGRLVTWQTSAPSVATVNSSGLATGAAVGTTIITASSEGVSASASLAVTATGDVDAVEVTPSSATISVGGTQQFNATLRASDGEILTGRAVTWQSSDAFIVSVNSSGLATGVRDGSAVITATSETVSGSATVTVGNPRYVSVASWGGNGTTDGKFAEARGVAIDSQGNIWVADKRNETIQKFDPSGNFLGKITTTIESAATNNGPTHIALNDEGYLYALAEDGFWVARYDENGNEERLTSPQFGLASILDFAVDAANGDFYVVFVGALAKYDSDGLLWQKELLDVETVAVDSQGDVYVTAFPGLQKYDSDGKLLSELDSPDLEGGLNFDSSDRLYLLFDDPVNKSINVYNGDLNLLTTYAIDALCWPSTCSFAIESDGQNMYVAFDSHAIEDVDNEVHKFARQ